MASNTRTLNFTIGGVTQAITNITQLEATVNQLDQQLAGATFGTQQFADLQEEARRARAALAGFQAQTQATSQAAGQAGQAAGQMGNQFQDAFGIASLAGGQTGQVLGQLQGSLQGLQGGIGTVGKAFGTLRGAIAGTGIGILLLAFGALVTYFTETQEGINLLDRKTKALQAVFNVFKNIVIGVGKSLFEAFQNPRKSLEDLVSAIQNNLTNRLKSFGVILDGILDADFTKVADGVAQMATGITDATSKIKGLGASLKTLGTDIAAAAAQGEALAVSNQKIVKQERDLKVARAESRAQIEGLKKASDDVTKSNAARLAAARQAETIEQGLIKSQISLQDRKIKNLLAEQALKGKQTADDLDAIAELREARATLSQDSTTLQTELQNKINGLRAEQKAKDEAALATRKASEEKAAADLKALREKEVTDTEASENIRFDIQKKVLERRLALEKAGTPEFLQIQLDARNLEEAIQLEAIDRRYEKAGSRERAALLKQKEDLVAAGKAADAKLEAENAKVAQENAKNKLIQAAQSEKELAEIKLIGVREGSREYYAALLEQINAEEKLALSQLDNTKENENARTRVIKQAAKDRSDLANAEASKPFNVGTSILTQIFGVKDEEVAKVKAAIDSMARYALDTTMTLLSQQAEARAKALDAQVAENQAIIDAAKAASDALKSELDESQSRIDDLEAKLVSAKGVERQKVIDQLVVERQRNQQINQDRAKEDTRIRQAEAQKVALEKQKTQEAEKQAKVQAAMNVLQAISVTVGATEAAIEAVKGIAKATQGGKLGFDNIAYALAATAALGGAFIAMKSAAKGFADGGFTGDGHGTPDKTGFRVAGVVHEDEYVVPKWMVTSPKYQGTIAQLEAARVSGGSRGFAEGGYAPVSVPQAQQGFDMSVLVAMNEELISLRADTNAALSKPIYLSHARYEEFDTDVNRIQQKFLK